jgi:lauroyl/myristoyl acyltransferase
VRTEVKTNQPAVLHGAARARSADPLRENFFLLFRRSYRIAEKKGEGLAVYHASAALTYRLCGEPWAQETIFPAEASLVRRFLAETALPVSDRESVVQHSLWANPWAATWTGTLQALGRDHFELLCSVSGLEHLRAAQATGRGIVFAHAHTVFEPLFWTWLAHEGIAPGVTIWGWAWGRKPSEIRDPRISTLEGARELHSAVATLRRGGLLHVLADGHRGNQKIILPFCNRQRGFARTFAELALSTNAVVMPVMVKSAAGGSISIQIYPVFAESRSGGDPAERIELLVRQYVEHLQRIWQACPADIPWYQMRRHVDLPPLGQKLSRFAT